MDRIVQEEEQNSDSNLNTGYNLAELHNPERNEGNHRSGLPPLTSSSGAGPETSQTDTQMDVDNGNQSTGQHSAEARRNTPGQPAMSEPLAGQSGSLLQPSEHSTQQNVMETSQTDTQMDVDNRNQTAGQHSPEAWINTPELGQPAMSGPLTGQQGSLVQPSQHYTQHNVMEGPSSSAINSTGIDTEERKVGGDEGNPRPGSSPPRASSSRVGPESSQSARPMDQTTGHNSSEASRNAPGLQCRGPLGMQSTTLLQSSVDSAQHSAVRKSLGPSARDPTKVRGCVGSSACENETHQGENEEEVYFDAQDGSDNSKACKPEEHWQVLSKTPSWPENVVMLKFVAVLRRAIILEPKDKMYLISNSGEKRQMDFMWHDDGVSSLFSCSFAVYKESCHAFAYRYCLAKNDKEQHYEDATPKRWFSVSKGDAFRRLSNIKDTDTVHYQFDDICMKNPSWSRWTGRCTKIDEVRLKFLKAVFLHLMNYQNADFSELQDTLEYFESYIKKRVICNCKGEIETISLNPDSKLITKAFVEAVQMQNIKASIQNVLVSAAIAKQFRLELDKTTLEHISLIVKNNGNLQRTLTALDDSVRLYMTSAVQYVVDMASRLKSLKAVVWLTGLFYAVCPPENKHTLTFRGFYNSVQRDLVEMIDTYSMSIGNQRAFASAVLQIFSPKDGYPQVLSKLNLSPKDLLCQLSVWLNTYEFHVLHEEIKEISSVIKQWVQSRLQSSVFTDNEKRDILLCLEQMMNMLKKCDYGYWTYYINNVYSVLHLFYSFNGCLDCLKGDKDFRAISRATLPVIIHLMTACIKRVLFSYNLVLAEWTKLFEIKSDVWQDEWENSLTKLFSERLQKENAFKLIELYAKTSHCPHAMEECLLRHVTKAISNVYGKQRNMALRNQQTLGRESLINIVSICPGYGKMLGLIIENVFEDIKWNPSDYLDVLYDGQITEIFKTLELRQKEKPHYKEHLSSKAKKFIQDTHTFLDKLPEYILSKSISCHQLSTIIERKKQPNTYTILNEPNLTRYHEVVQEAEKSFKSFREMQRKMRALHNICQGSPVDTQLLKSVMSLDLSTEKRSLRGIMERLSPDSEENPQLINSQMFEKIHVLSDSTYFKQIWRKVAKHVKITEFENVSSIPLNQVYNRIFQPAVEEFRNSFEELMNLSMTLEDLEDKMGKFLKKNAHEKEMQYMKIFFDDSKSGWVENTCEHIKRYQELCLAVENANVVNDLKEKLGLKGDFCAIGNLQVMSHKCLRDLTLEMHKAGEIVKKFPNYVIGFLNELSICVENGFISWIKDIIKDTGELSAFVELASISAGENALDIDKVCYFRDAISAAAPLIYGLTENSGFNEFKDAVRDVQSELINDKTLKEKLRDSCKNRDWLEIAYETHGSVERSSLRQATDINESGIYTIRRPLGQTVVTLENCISLKCKEVSSDGKSEYRPYSLTELKELQNKLMLITVTQDNREDGITNYVEVLEHIINVGRSFIELCDAGHVLFKDWEMTAYCECEREAKIWVNFGLTNVEIKGNRPLLLELKGLCESMKCCLSEWLKYVEAKRNKYYTLNHFTAKQLVNLCCSMAEVQYKDEISASLLNMLSIIKEDITDEDVKIALTDALQTPAEDSGSQGSAQLKRFLSIYPDHLEYFTGFGLTEEVSKAGIMYCEQQAHEGGISSESTSEYRDFVMEHIDEHQDDDDWVQEWSEKYEKTKDDVLDSQMKFKGAHSSEQISSFTMTEDEISSMFENLNHCDEKIVMLWKTYQNKLSGLVSDKFVDLDVLGETIQQIANSATAIVQRKPPLGLEAGKPNLISCKDVEMAPLCLSVYSVEEQLLPSYDEILICTPETTAEEMELILRRALQSGSRHEKIYSLLNADKLNHEVSRKLESTFYKLSKTDSSTTDNYRLIIYCDSKASHSYVTTAFDYYKRMLPENPHRNQQIKQYFMAQHKMPLESKDGFGKLHCFQNFPQMTKLVFSEYAGMGKSLYVKSLVNAMQDVKKEGFTHKTIRLSESHLRPEHIIQQFQAYEDKPTDTVPRLFHFDVPPVISKGLYAFLLQLFVLRCFQSPDGSMWRCSKSHVYLVEYTRRTNRECDRHNSEISIKMEEVFLEMFPNVKCLSPEDTQMYLSEGGQSVEEYQLMDMGEFSSEAFQRTYQYFKRYEQNQLESFSFTPGSCEDSPKEWLQCLMRYCDNRTPSWGELRNFTHFLNMQLKKCEQSIFCSDILSQDLTGFKKFVVKFMITMSKDFSMRSLMISDESTEKEVNPEEDAVLKEFQLRRRWEQQAHPYIMFNADNNSMTFLGFHIHNLHAIDSRSGQIVEERVIDRVLFTQLRAQKVPFNIDFEKLPRKEQLDIISRVLGVDSITDPDDTYQLTLDNVMKILAIHLRFESDIPVIIMGETGCGKTRLVQFMCDLLRSGKQGKNMIVVRVHGGTTSETIYRKVQEAVEISKLNETQDMDTVLFFDEANTTEAVNAIKEVICDKSVNGEPIDAHRLKIIAACNPYRKHSQEAIEQLEKAGLGYRVRSENTEEKLGQIPMRQLVYRVQPLPPSLSPLVWDFGKLNEKTQELYIQQMVKTFFQKEKDLPKEYETLFTKVISASQMHMIGLTDECRMVSLRDIERCMKTVMWFYQQKDKLFPEMDEHSPNSGIHELVRSLILAIGVCYMASLENRGAYLEKVAKELSLTSEAISTEIESCKKVFIENVDCPPSVAKNDALKENVFMMVVCMNLRIPLFLVGKPGSSKSLSKTIAAHAMQGKSSQRELFKGFKKAQLASFQCSPHSSPDGIISVFRQCAQFQKDKNLDEYVSVVVLDEIGLAEDSPKMPLKTLHPLLEYGCVDDEHPEDFKKVSFIGISNWSLDPAKMNRGILVLRTSPEFEELENTALAICPQDEEHILPEIKILITSLTEFYQEVLHEQEKFSEFFGLRDFYSLVKLIVSYAIETNGRPSNEDLTKAIQRNFGGFDSIDILKIFWDVFGQKTEKCDTISLLRENLEEGTSGFTSRYLLLPTTNHAALQILKLKGIINEDTTEVIFGSGFPHDEEYSQVCRTVNRVKACMETGTAVILLNIQSLYESLYDALNQCYVKLGGSYYVDLGLGSHRVKCRVKDEFRLIVIEEKSTVYEQFPTPLLNRLEKHCVEISNILPPYAKEMQNELENWLKVFVTIDMYEEEATDILRKKHDCIIGYTEDTCASVLLQCCPDIVSCYEDLHGSESEEELADFDKRNILDSAKEKLLQCATPDSVLKASKNGFSVYDALLEVYFVKQHHGNMMKTLMKHRKEAEGLNLEVSTFSRLLNKRDLEQINNQLSIGENDSCLYLINEFYTEQSFSQTIRDFLVGDTSARKLVLLQSYFECAKQSQRILFCVRHSIMRLRNMLKEAPLFDVVLITRLPRISGGCGYIASFGDDWMSLHLDELIPTPGFPGDIYQLQSMTVSEILQESAAPCFEENDMEGLQESRPTVKEVSLVDTLLLIKKSLQKGILQLQDKADNTQRATKRIEILHGLLHNKYEVSEAFIAILQRRIISLLSAQEKKENWVIAQALSGHFVAEGGSFRHMLWVYLEDTVASALTQILAVIDGDNNLDNLINDSSPEMTVLWLKIFQEEKWDLLNIPATQSQGKVCVVSSTRLNSKSRTCLFPFGWVLKERLHCLWSNVINLKGPCPYPLLEHLEKFEEQIPLDWVKDIKGNSELFARFSEDLVNMTMTAYPHDLNKSFSNTLLKLTPCLYHDLTGKDPENVSLPWLFVAYQYMQDNHQHFYKLYLQNNDLVDAGEATEALRRTIESLHPKEDIMKDFAGCQDWIKKVKSLSMSVEVMLSENSLVTRLRENGTQLLTEIRLFWQSTRIMYLLMDHLLQHETDMEKKLLILLVRNLIWMWKNLNSKNGSNLEYVIEKVTGTLTKCGKNACNIFMVYCAYCDKEFTENDTVELKCGHMFHLSCLREHSDTHCRKCKKEISTDYKLCGVVDKETFLKVSRFRRKCSSFFVEFMWNFVPTKTKLTDKIVEELLNYVRGSSSSEAKKEEKSSLEECLKSDPATYSLVLKILLRCGMEESASQLQKFMDAAVSSSENNTEELYFMIVRSMEDHIHSSNQGYLKQKAQECLSTCTLSRSDPDNANAEDLHMIAKLRFAISVASDVIHTVLTEGEQVITDKGNKQLLQSLEILISDSSNPWIQIFLLRNVCKMYGFSIIRQLGDRFKWAMPHESFVKQDTSAEQMDPFLMYGDLYEHVVLDSMDQSQRISEDIDRSSAFFPVSVALAAVRQAALNQNAMLQGSEGSLIEKMKVEPNTGVKWRGLIRICEKMTEDPLEELSPSLAQIVFHTAVVVHQSSAPEVALLRTLCFRPGNAKDFYLPTMPSSVAEIMNWIKPEANDLNVVWRCQCGEPVVIGNCGRPWVTDKCVNCGQDVGGERHKPVEGFQKTENEAGNGKGHNLGDPRNRKDQDGERNLFGAHLLLVRALLHSSLIWGTVDHCEEIQNIVQYETTNVREYLCHHLQKDIDLLAHALGKSMEDAEIAVHLFLKHIMETKSENEEEDEDGQGGEEQEEEEEHDGEEDEDNEEDDEEVQEEEEEILMLEGDGDEDDEEEDEEEEGDEEEDNEDMLEEEEEDEPYGNLTDTDNQIATTETEEKRMNWETSIHQKLQTLFMDFEDCFSSVHSNILGKGGMKTLAQIVYNPVPDLQDLPTTGVFNLPLMWRFEQRMTIQLLSHLIEQKDEWNNLPVLKELLKNSGHIRYIRHLPQVLSLQHKVMHHFRNVDLQCYENVPIRTFKKENISEDEGHIFDENVEIMKMIWDHLTTIEYPRMPKEIIDKKKEDLRILDLLPRPKSVIYVVTDYLVRMQNDCINCANPKEDRLIKTSEVKPSHVIDCTPEQDFLTIAMSNIDRVVSEDGTESTYYNFRSLERQIVDRFFTEKPIINVNSIPSFEYNTGTTLRAFFSTVKEHLEPLNTNERNSILNDFRFLNEISAALSTLKIAIGFMQLSFPSADEYLVTYLKKELKLEDRTHTLSLPVLRTSRVKHIQSLWEVLSLRQSSLLLEMNQNPFFMIESGFHETFSKDLKKKITSSLANLTKMELFITELHYIIMNIPLREVAPGWGLQETFDAFVDSGEIDEGVLESVESMMELELQMKNSIALWKMAVEMKRGLSG